MIGLTARSQGHARHHARAATASAGPCDEATRRRRRWIIGAAVLLTLVPSIYLAAELVRDEWFASRAQR